MSVCIQSARCTEEVCCRRAALISCEKCMNAGGARDLYFSRDPMDAIEGWKTWKTAAAATQLRFTCWYRSRTDDCSLYFWTTGSGLLASLNFHQHFVLYYSSASYVLFLGKRCIKNNMCRHHHCHHIAYLVDFSWGTRTKFISKELKLNLKPGQSRSLDLMWTATTGKWLSGRNTCCLCDF